VAQGVGAQYPISASNPMRNVVVFLNEGHREEKNLEWNWHNAMAIRRVGLPEKSMGGKDSCTNSSIETEETRKQEHGGSANGSRVAGDGLWGLKVRV